MTHSGVEQRPYLKSKEHLPSLNHIISHLVPSAAFVTASSGTLSSVNLATERLKGRPCAMEKDAQADVAAGSAARINAVTFILDDWCLF